MHEHRAPAPPLAPGGGGVRDVPRHCPCCLSVDTDCRYHQAAPELVALLQAAERAAAAIYGSPSEQEFLHIRRRLNVACEQARAALGKADQELP